MATATKPKPAATLTDAEVAALGQIGASSLPTLPGDGSDLVLTEAETLLLAGKGATIQHSDNEGRFDEENPYGVEAGTRLFKIGEGEAQFTGTMTHSNPNQERVFLWWPTTGVKRALVRAHLMYYVAKGWLPRPPEGVEPPALTFKCLSITRCRKRFSNPYDMTEHFNKSHATEAKMAKQQRETARQERLDAILERLVENGGGADNNSAIMAALLTELTSTVKDLQTGVTAVSGAPAADAAAVAEGVPGDAA